MSTRIVRANARRSPKATTHPDAELFALAERIVEIHKGLEVSRHNLAEALHTVDRAPTHPALRKTEADAQFGFFVGPRVGYLYRQEEIDRIRAFVRAETRTIAETDEEASKPFYRALEILDAWATREEREDVKRVSDVERERRSKQKEYDGLATELILMRPATVAGVMRKAKALAPEASIDEEEAADNLDSDLSRYGPDEQAVTLSLTRDLLRLANAEAGR